MKILVRCLVVFMLLFCATGATFAQQQIRMMESFSAIDLDGRMVVELVPTRDAQGRSYVEVAFHGLDKRNLSWGVRDSVLQMSLGAVFSPGGYARVRVYYGELNSIVASRGTTVTTLPDSVLVVEDLDIACSGKGSEVTLALQGNAVACRASSGGRVVLRGESVYSNFKTSTGGVVDAVQMSCMDLMAKVGMWSEVSAAVTDLVDARVSMWSTLYYLGEPYLKTKTSMGGKVVEVEPYDTAEAAPEEDSAVVVEEEFEADPL